MMDNDVYDRLDESVDTIGHSQYNLLIGAVLLWGFLVNYFMVQLIDPKIIFEVNPYIFIAIYLGTCTWGVKLFKDSDNPAISFLGYNLVVVPFGLIINAVVSSYAPDLVLNAIVTTGCVTASMMILGATFPAFFEGIIGPISLTLLMVILIELLLIFVFRTDLHILDWIVALIFCGYIGYDWGRANKMPKTVDNAIDGAAAIYMDIINLFLRILSIMGKSRK